MNDDRLDHDEGLELDEGLDPETSELLASVEPGADFPRDAIRERIRASVARREASEPPTSPRSPWLKVGAAIAASLVIFVAGAEYGRRVAAPGVPSQATEATGLAVEPAFAASVPLSIQTHGSQYVAEMARMAETIDQMTPDERQQAREVALAVLYGAAAEILRAGPQDDAAASVAKVLLAQKQIATDDGSLRIY